ncbi:hypothetical protein WR25_11368 [Diploscapter pachys]|uniref:G-protein coupled receptors family 1 profile domain-containing protein n=1 Tax=Diploscapter pachys TaxID=2018661 RepID=A0A2A2JM25_9BILA|nr:hypothetical protein WR25_11368 [Diploscapter pachys]
MLMEPDQLDKYCSRGLNRSELIEEEYRLAPFNDSCLENFFTQLTNSLRRFNRWEEIIYTIIYVIISILAIIGNGLVVWVVLRKKAMRTNRNVLILNLALANLMLAIINVPFLWLPMINFEFVYSRFFCKFANVLPGIIFIFELDRCNVYCSTLTISVMAIDRYYSVKKLRVQSTGVQCFRACGISVAIWVASFLLSLPLLLHYDTTILYVMKLTMGATQLVFLYIIPLFVLTIFNMKLTRFLKTNADQMNRNRGQKRSSDSLSVTKRHSEISSKKVSLVNGNNTLHSPSIPSVKSSIAERASQRRNSRTTSLLIAMAGSYALLWFPYSVVTLLLDLDVLFHETYATVIDRIDQMCKMISMLSICVNPFLYGFLNTNFRHEFTAIYYRLVRCQRKPFDGSSRYTHDFSSVALPTRHNSLHANDQLNSSNGLLSSIRQSFRGSFHRMRSSFHSDATPGHNSFRSDRSGRAASADHSERAEPRARQGHAYRSGSNPGPIPIVQFSDAQQLQRTTLDPDSFECDSFV